MQIELKDLKCYLLHGNSVRSEYTEIYDRTYAVWKLVWQQTLAEVDGPTILTSDGFTRQTKVISLFHKNECVGLVSFRETDMSLISQRDDSLLSAWTTEALAALQKDGSQISICTNLTVAHQFRGPIAPNLSFKALLCYLVTEVLLDSNCDAMTGTMRVQKGTEKAAYRAGATKLAQSEMHGEACDLVAFYRRQIASNFHQSSNPWSRELWEFRIDTRVSEHIQSARPQHPKAA